MKQAVKSLIFSLIAPLCFKSKRSDFVYLTFDDGPHPENTPRILAVLAEHQVKATFFMIGHWMQTYPEIVQQIHSQGHTIGYHAFRHQSLKKTSWRELREDLKQLKAIEKQFEIQIKLFRPPFGDLTLSGLLGWVFSGRKIALWNVDSRDSFDPYEQVVENLSPANIKAGDILLLHDDYQQTEELLTAILPKLADARLMTAPL